MKSKFLLIFGLLVITTISACSGQTTQTPLEPATPAAIIVQPTETTAATETSLPVPTNTQPDATATSSPTETPAAAAATTSVSFASDVMPIFESGCVNCHGGEQVKEGLNMKTYEGLMAGSFNGAVIEPGNATNSFLVVQVVNGEMPKRGPKLTPEQIQIISDWINAGALNN